MRDAPSVGPRLYFPLHSRGLNRNCPSQLLPRYRPARHLLRSSPFPLCPIYGCRLCYHGRLCSLIPPVLWVHPSQHMNQDSLRNYVCWSKPDLLPPTLPGSCRHATTLLRLPGCLHPLKHCLLSRIANLPYCRGLVPLHPLRGICG